MNQVTKKNRKDKDTDVPQLKRKEYDQKLHKLHIELVKLQEWVKREGKKVCVVFEGRDGAGKGGVIKALTERVSPAFSASLPWPLRRNARSRKCIFSDTCSIFLPGGRSLSSTAVGTIAPESNVSWAFARRIRPSGS